MKNLYDLPVHPLALKFPPMSEREIDELAEDIRAHGQRDPICIEQKGHFTVECPPILGSCRPDEK